MWQVRPQAHTRARVCTPSVPRTPPPTHQACAGRTRASRVICPELRGHPPGPGLVCTPRCTFPFRGHFLALPLLGLFQNPQNQRSITSCTLTPTASALTLLLSVASPEVRLSPEHAASPVTPDLLTPPPRASGAQSEHRDRVPCVPASLLHSPLPRVHGPGCGLCWKEPFETTRK